MTLLDDFQRVHRGLRCPVCGRPDWCLVSRPRHDETDRAICARVESPTRCGDAGWLHRLEAGQTPPAAMGRMNRQPRADAAPRRELGALSRRCGCALSPDRLNALADALGLSAESLRRLRTGWADYLKAFTFPMADVGGQVRGIRLRFMDGRKLAIRGGREGLFIPSGMVAGDAEPLLVCEGPTDTAAMLDLGFTAIGRPSCMGGKRLVVELTERLRPGGVVIVADSDGPGRRGAESLEAVLLPYVHELRLITPPAGVKDARDWKRRGATHRDIQAAIDAVKARRLAVQARRINDGK